VQCSSVADFTLTSPASAAAAAAEADDDAAHVSLTAVQDDLVQISIRMCRLLLTFPTSYS